MVLIAWEVDAGRQMKKRKMGEVRNMSPGYPCNSKNDKNSKSKQDTIPTLGYMSLGWKLYMKGTLF